MTNDERARATKIVRECAERALHSSGALAAAFDQQIDAALSGMADRVFAARTALASANAQDVAAAAAAGMPMAVQDRLRLTGPRLDAMAEQLHTLAETPHQARETVLETRGDGLVLRERVRPIGVVGANYEARANVTLDIASQLVKSRNAGVLRTGSAALASSRAILAHVIAPALSAAGLPADAVQLIPSPDHAAAFALVEMPDAVPLVILRGSGRSTRDLGRHAAEHGVRTLAHADGGGVLYIDADADVETAHGLVSAGLDRLGVCNRLNLLLVDRPVYEQWLPGILGLLDKLGIAASLPPHDHAIGHEWALDDDRAATVTVAVADGPLDAAGIANRETSGLAASIATTSAEKAAVFINAYTGAGAFWNASTRLLDGYTLFRLPETGINIDRSPGPRGPVTYRDLHLRQYVVTPAAP